MSTSERDALLDRARALKRASKSALSRPLLLRGRNIGLLCEAPDSDDAERFVRAAGELGAQVAHIRPSVCGLADPDEVVHIARMLGRLYDGIECEGLPADLVCLLSREAGVPVYDGIGSANPLVASLASQVDGTDDADNRWCLVQALLVNTIRTS